MVGHHTQQQQQLGELLFQIHRKLLPLGDHGLIECIVSRFTRLLETNKCFRTRAVERQR